MKIIFGYYEDEDFGLTPYPDISYPDKGKFDSFEEYEKEEEKIGEFVLWALEQSDNTEIRNASEVKFEKKYSNTSSYSQFSRKYNMMLIPIEGSILTSVVKISRPPSR